MFGIPTYSDTNLDEYEQARVFEMSESIDVRQALKDHDLAPGTLTVRSPPDDTKRSFEGIVGVVGGQGQDSPMMAVHADLDEREDSVSLFPMDRVHRIAYDIDELEAWIETQIDRMLDDSDDADVSNPSADGNFGY
jgi:hypothetical protein